MWPYYSWDCCSCRLSVSAICGRIMVGLAIVALYVVALWLGLSLLSSVSKHNMLSYYGWNCRCCQSVNTKCGRIMDGFVIAFVSQ